MQASPRYPVDLLLCCACAPRLIYPSGSADAAYRMISNTWRCPCLRTWHIVHGDSDSLSIGACCLRGHLLHRTSRCAVHLTARRSLVLSTMRFSREIKLTRTSHLQHASALEARAVWSGELRRATLRATAQHQGTNCETSKAIGASWRIVETGDHEPKQGCTQ